VFVAVGVIEVAVTWEGAEVVMTNGRVVVGLSGAEDALTVDSVALMP
jgi:hypothetical protein